MLDWISAEEGRKSTYKKLFLVWQPGYPLTVCDWVSGHGYRDIRTGLSMDPVCVAVINLPSIDFATKNVDKLDNDEKG